MKPVAIVGLGDGHDNAPWRDSAWEKWVVGHDHYLPFADRVFEIHGGQRDEWTDRIEESGTQAIVMAPGLFTNETLYPLVSVVNVGGDYFGSTIAYMLALAIYEGRKEIGLWGVEVQGNYDHQRPNIEYLIGLARGKGRTVDVHGSTDLLTLPASLRPRYPGKV